MTTEITITGVGCPIPTATDAGPGVLVRSNGIALQFDAGRSTTQRLMAAGSDPLELDALFLTHHHSDHVTGVVDILLTRWVMDRGDKRGAALPVVAPTGPSTAFVEHCLDAYEDDLAVRREHTGRTTRPGAAITAFGYPDGVTAVWERDGVTVSAGQVRHEPVHPAVGYRIDTPDGSIAITGDTLVCDEVAELADGVDVLVYEAMRFAAFDGMPRERTFVLDYHADTIEIGRQAAELDVPTLVLTHLIPPARTDEDRAGFEADVRSGGYEGTVIVAQDLTTVAL